MKAGASTLTSELGTVVFLIFLVLKLTGKIGWSWWWVTAPLWMQFAAGIVIAAVVVPVLLVRERRANATR